MVVNNLNYYNHTEYASWDDCKVIRDPDRWS